MTEFIKQCAEKDTLTKEDRKRLVEVAEEIKRLKLIISGNLDIYADLGEEFDKVKLQRDEYKQKLADGRMVELPCKEGEQNG